MDKLTKKILKVACKNIRKKGDKNNGWPPPCIGYLYQPQRPVGMSKLELSKE